MIIDLEQTKLMQEKEYEKKIKNYEKRLKEEQMSRKDVKSKTSVKLE